MKHFYLVGIALTLLSSTLYSQVDVLTQHNDNQRTGWNSQETVLKAANVKAGLFGKQFTYTVDDQVYAQILIATGINIPGVGTRNVAYVCTVNNTVYAFDADSAIAAGSYWQKNLTLPGNRTPLNSDMVASLCPATTGGYLDLTGKIGIVGTPVIDKTAGFMYLVSRDVTTDASKIFKQYLCKINIATGAVVDSVRINATVTGSGTGSSGGTLSFSEYTQNQRPGLLLQNGVVYIGYSSHCDMDPYHGWVLGYDATSLAQKYVYCTTANGDGGGIWQSGNGLAADNAGNIYAATGNGSTDTTATGTNRAASLLKLTPPATGNQLTLSDYFTPNNWRDLDDGDLDFGPCETLVLTGINRVLTGGKDGRLYLCDINNLGKYTNYLTNTVVDSLSLGSNARNHTSFGYYKGASNEYLYTWPENTNLLAWSINHSTGKFTNDRTPAMTSGITPGPAGNSGATMSTSSNGSVDSTAILWITHADKFCDANHQTCPGIFRAVSATDVNKELWNSTQVTADTIGNYAKFNAPTVANGKVYVASFSKKIMVYGLSAFGDTCNSSNVALNQPAFASSSQFTDGTYAAGKAFDGDMSTRWSSQFSDNQWLGVNLGKSYDLCRVAIYWETALGKDYDIQVSNDSLTWKTIYTVTGNTVTTNVLPLQGSGKYVRMLGIHRGTGNGYSIYEMQVYGTPTVTCFPPGGLTASNIQQNSATLSWDAVSGATGYVVTYMPQGSSSGTVINTTATSVDLNGVLSPGTSYVFTVQTNCSSGTSTAASSGFSTLASTTCGTLPTRWTATDIGGPTKGGQSCYDGSSSTFTLQGSGSGVTGTSDQLQFAFTSLSGDDQFIAQILTLDNDANDMAGIMIRNSTSPTSPFAFVALTSGGTHAVFQTRATDGGTSSGTPITIPGLPYWVKLQKLGSVYTAFTSPNGNTWTQLGSAMNLGFGAGGPATSAGLAITSGDNSLLAQTTMNNVQQGSALPIELLSFTGRISGQGVLLQWATGQEENASHFEIQRSGDGVHFTTINTVQAVGNSNSEQDYSITDAEPIKGINYYRLREVDLDGRSMYTPIILVRFSNVASPTLLPNPAISYFQIVAGTDPIREVNVYDLAGRMMLQAQNGSASSSTTIPCGRLSPGIYIVEIKTANGRYVQKLQKQ